MAYKTLTLQLYRPGRRKCALMDRALLRYSQALQELLSRCEYRIDALAESGAQISQKMLLTLIDKKTLKDLNGFHVQPFKDSLKIEFAALAAAYIAQKRADPAARYPLAYLDAPHYRAAVSLCADLAENSEKGRREFASACSKLIDRVGRLRPLYFGRYAVNRDYCLLYDKFKDRFYAKLYLLNAADGYFSKAAAGGLSLQYVAEGMPAMSGRDEKKRYLVVPLAFGKKQYGDLKRALENPGLLHTARLTKRDGRYYLMVNIACGLAPALPAESTMGVSRGFFGGLNYTVCGPGGEILKQGRISGRAEPGQAAYLLCGRIVKIARENRSQVILEANGGKNDQLPARDEPARRISNWQYAALAAILQYRLPEQGLPPPVEVSANGLFSTCPRCAKRTARNRISDELFACVECGYASEAEWIGSENLAGRLIRYRCDKVPLTVLKQDDSLVFYNKSLGFRCALPQNVTDYKPMYDELGRYLQSLDGTFQNDSKKYAVWKKLRQAPSLRDAVRLVLK